ncbi:LacI family DNA-binding transcriptional regulator [Plantactinospora soyae]|uniref:DNA-binding LacI/PurR family transcriptional regulator n=1 Tax=Plantactinospora soyae TaxID=1544732 RepID=A0A927R7Q4_9ACTN|nr:LacI family DNA-binding transcriptional regulator [Plantactinospora soyae]MBE1489689.1 DNA-binding LacI/PurR family transcriptional regulator [Plantactinospora soyae]
MGRRIRQADIALKLGISQATVSVVLSGRAGRDIAISPELRDLVLRTAQDMGYHADPVARSLAGGRNHLLGVFTFEPVFPVGQRDFYHPFLLGIEQEAEAQRYDLVLFTSATDGAGRRSIYGSGTNRLRLADGGLLLGLAPDREELARLVREQFPFVFIGRRDVHGAGLSYVAADYVGATANLVGELIALGHENICLVTGTVDLEPTVDRKTGFVRAHELAGRTVRPRSVWEVEPAGIGPAELLSRRDQGVTAYAVEGAADGELVGAFLAAAAQANLAVPDDVSLVVLGDVDKDGVAQRCTRFAVQREEMGRRAVRLLIDKLEAKDPSEVSRVTVPCVAIPGDTVGVRRDPRPTATPRGRPAVRPPRRRPAPTDQPADRPSS